MKKLIFSISIASSLLLALTVIYVNRAEKSEENSQKFRDESKLKVVEFRLYSNQGLLLIIKSKTPITQVTRGHITENFKSIRTEIQDVLLLLVPYKFKPEAEFGAVIFNQENWYSFSPYFLEKPTVSMEVWNKLWQMEEPKILSFDELEELYPICLKEWNFPIGKYRELKVSE